jgi:hypothetical protein
MTYVQTTSRYSKTVSQDGVYEAKRKYSNNKKYYTYTTKEGDSFDLIANRVFQDPERFWEIADLNPHVPFPDEIPVGTSVRIPAK